jgi:hypothetical protein
LVNPGKPEGRQAVKRKVILVLAAVWLVAGLAACDQATPSTYELTHSATDADYILGWDEITDLCPDLEDYDKMEVFIVRGETVESPTGGEDLSLSENSPVAWESLCLVTKGEGGNVRGFVIMIAFCETDDYLDELIEELNVGGVSFEEDGDFMTAVLENELTEQSTDIMLAGKNFLVVIAEFASGEESLFCGRDAIEELIDLARSHISSLEITPLPADIPKRVVAE